MLSNLAGHMRENDNEKINRNKNWKKMMNHDEKNEDADKVEGFSWYLF